MADEQKSQTNMVSDDLDEVLVKDPDGTFRVVKMQTPITNPPGGVVTGQAAALTKDSKTLPRTASPLPAVRPAAAIKVFDRDEEKELAIAGERAKTMAPTTPDTTTATVDRMVREVRLPDPSLQSRLRSVLVAFVKGVRNEMETRALLARPKEQGGLALTIDEATRTIALVNAPAAVPEPLRKIASSPDRGRGPRNDSAPKPAPPSLSKSLVVSPRPSTPPPVLQPLPKPVTPATPLRPSPPPSQVMRPVTPSPSPAKPIVQDVSFAQPLTGPVDELRMRLLDWRRMAPTVKDRATTIEHKLQLLEEEAYTERLKGIAAWYESEVVRLYQEITRTSLAEGKPVATILATLQSANQQTLSMEEFQSVAEVNERIRF